MKAMVFAAGYGTRLRPLTDQLPKAMIPVAGRPMIEYPLRLLRHYGITEIIINLHHLGEKIEEHLGDGRKLGLRIAYSKEKELLDTGGGLLQARSFLQDETFVVINNDVIIDLRLQTAIDQHRQHGPVATLVLRPDLQADRYGALEISADGKVQKFLSHQGPLRAASGPLRKLMFTGVQILEPKIFDYMTGENPGPFGTTKVTYPKMLTAGEKLCGFLYDGFWQDLGTPQGIKEVEAKLSSGAAKLHYLDD
ncbi:MAG TPA: NDP-sugar synthase [Candidatus Binatia bacterium]|jgi:NDP-sugar pyrophosphorylase family protein